MRGISSADTVVDSLISCPVSRSGRPARSAASRPSRADPSGHGSPSGLVGARLRHRRGCCQCRRRSRDGGGTATPERRKLSRCGPVRVDESSARPVAPPLSRLVRSVLASYTRSPAKFALVLGCLGYQVAFNLFVPLVTRFVFDDIHPQQEHDEFVLVVA